MINKSPIAASLGWPPFWDGRLFMLLMFLAASAHAAVIKVACIGDSITYGYELPADQSYPANLQRLLGSGYDVRNFGRNGAGVLKRGAYPYWGIDLFQTSTAFGPDIAVIMLGTNDSKPDDWGRLSAEFEGDYVAFVQHYQGLGATVYVATPPPAQAHTDYWQVHLVLPHVNNVIQISSAREIDVSQAMNNSPHYFMDDVHPNAQGYEFLAQVIYTAITGSPCNLNGDSSTNVSDVQLCANQAIGALPCTTGDINRDTSCNVMDVQRVVNAALGGQCVTQ